MKNQLQKIIVFATLALSFTAYADGDLGKIIAEQLIQKTEANSNKLFAFRNIRYNPAKETMVIDNPYYIGFGYYDLQNLPNSGNLNRYLNQVCAYYGLGPAVNWHAKEMSTFFVKFVESNSRIIHRDDCSTEGRKMLVQLSCKVPERFDVGSVFNGPVDDPIGMMSPNVQKPRRYNTACQVDISAVERVVENIVPYQLGRNVNLVPLSLGTVYLNSKAWRAQYCAETSAELNMLQNGKVNFVTSRIGNTMNLAITIDGNRFELGSVGIYEEWFGTVNTSTLTDHLNSVTGRPFKFRASYDHNSIRVILMLDANYLQ